MASAGTSREALLKADESAFALLCRGQSKPVPTGLALVDHLGLRKGDLLELHGPAGAGKTQWGLTAMAHTVLPRAHNGCSIGGQEANVVLFDNDSKFHLWRFLQVLETRLKRAALATLPPGSTVHDVYTKYGGKAAYQALVKECLSRLTVFRCTTGHELQCAVSAVLQWPPPAAAPAASAPPRPLPQLVVLDPLGPGAFHWTDRTGDMDWTPVWLDALLQLKAAYSCIILAVTGPTAQTSWVNPAELGRDLAELTQASAALPGLPQPLPPYREVGLPESAVKYRVLLAAAGPSAFRCRVALPPHAPLAPWWVRFHIHDEGAAF